MAIEFGELPTLDDAIATIDCAVCLQFHTDRALLLPASPAGTTLLDWLETFAARLTSGSYRTKRSVRPNLVLEDPSLRSPLEFRSPIRKDIDTQDGSCLELG